MYPQSRNGARSLTNIKSVGILGEQAGAGTDGGCPMAKVGLCPLCEWLLHPHPGRPIAQVQMQECLLPSPKSRSLVSNVSLRPICILSSTTPILALLVGKEVLHGVGLTLPPAESSLVSEMGNEEMECC